MSYEIPKLPKIDNYISASLGALYVQQESQRKIAQAAFDRAEKQRQAVLRTADNTDEIKDDLKRVNDSLKIEAEDRKLADIENQKLTHDMNDKNMEYTKNHDKKNFILGVIGTSAGIVGALAGIAALIVSLIKL